MYLLSTILQVLPPRRWTKEHTLLPKPQPQKLKQFKPWYEVHPKGNDIYKVSVKKTAINLRIDSDVLAALKATGKGYQTRINDVLAKNTPAWLKNSTLWTKINRSVCKNIFIPRNLWYSFTTWRKTIVKKIYIKFGQTLEKFDFFGIKVEL